MKKNLLFIQRLLTVFVLLLFCTISAHAQDWNQIIKATAGDRNKITVGQRETNTGFGYSVAISGNYAFVGATGSALGVYISKYIGGKWEQIKTLSSPEELINVNTFGSSLSVSGDYLIVGSGNAAFIYRKDPGGADDWFLVKKVIGLNADVAGTAVAIDGDYAVVTTPNVNLDGAEENSITAAGSAYIFKKDQGGADNWGQIKIITAPVPVINDHFGGKVAISGDHIIVGSYSAALIYRQTQGGTDNWGLVKNITNSAPAGDYVLRRVAIDGDYAMIGNPSDGLYYDNGEELYTDAGSVYIFKKGQETGSWFQVQKIIADYPHSDYAFGSAVAIDGDYIAIGSPGYGSEYNGTIFTYKKNPESTNQWVAGHQVPLELARFSSLGSNLAISGDIILAGNSGASDTGSEIWNYGLAYTFQKDLSGPEAWGTQQTLQLGRIVPGDNFGYKVAISGNYAAIGVPDEDADTGGLGYRQSAGAVYILYNNSGNWQQVKKITAPGHYDREIFGYSVSIDGDYVVVGAPNEEESYEYSDPAQGLAYIFQKDQGGTDNWGFVKRLVPSVSSRERRFAVTVSISGDYAIVGAPVETNTALPNNLGFQAGAVYIYQKNLGGENNWGTLKKVTASVSRAGDNFGKAISISGDYFIVGAPNESEDALESNEIYSSGSAYIFKKDSGGPNQWGQIKKITSEERLYNGLFGYNLSISSNYAVVSTFAGNGSVTVFDKNVGGTDNWGLAKTLVSPADANERFGLSVSVSGDFVAAGASSASVGGLENAGSAYVFQKDQGGPQQWGQVQQLTASVPAAGDLFGLSVAISGNYLFAGVPGDDEDEAEANPLSNAGSVYIFRNGSPLPVTLATFEASKKENTALLQWTTSAETNTDHFEILRSTDAKSWEILGHVEAANESTELLSYTFTDYKPAAGENFYRLKMVDRAADRRDGTFTYSRIRNVSFDITGNITLYPNPVSERLFFTDSELDKIASVSIINVLGQKVLQVSKITKEGIAIHQLSAGMYLVQVKRKNGTMQMNKILVAR